MTTQTLTLTCPSWCQDTERHDATDLMSRASKAAPGAVEIIRPHTGPSFGPFNSGGDSDVATGEVEAEVWLDTCAVPNGGYLTADGLRQLAADAVAAAEWLEANR